MAVPEDTLKEVTVLNETLLGGFVNARRKEMGLSLRELAAKAGVSPSQLSKIERGFVNNPSDETVEKLAYAINEDKDMLSVLAGRVRKESVESALPFILGFPVSLLAAPVVRAVRNAKKNRENFTQEIEGAISAFNPGLSPSDAGTVAKEMVAAYDLTMKRLKALPKEGDSSGE